MILPKVSYNHFAETVMSGFKSRGYCLEMICADFLAGAHVSGGGDPEVLFDVVRRSYQLMPVEQGPRFFNEIQEQHAATLAG
jgi:hypothetical protein